MRQGVRGRRRAAAEEVPCKLARSSSRGVLLRCRPTCEGDRAPGRAGGAGGSRKGSLNSNFK